MCRDSRSHNVLASRHLGRPRNKGVLEFHWAGHDLEMSLPSGSGDGGEFAIAEAFDAEGRELFEASIGCDTCSGLPERR
jgi:hypothetical protein